MKIIISPAKKMRTDTDSLPWRDYPAFLSKTEVLCGKLQSMSRQELKKLWKCNDQILDLNIARLEAMDLQKCLTPALLAYEGIQYRYMAPGVFSDREFEYLQNHLRILSGFYGVLKPFDGVTPYRLEMQAKLPIANTKDLYAYWGSDIADKLWEESDCIINLASREYSLCVSRYQPVSGRFITCVFGEQKNGKVIEKGTMCKMARGEMVRYMAEHQISDPDELRTFDRLGYQFREEQSNRDTLVYIKEVVGE